MRLFVFIFVSALLCATPLRADDNLPPQKPGLWEIKSNIEKLGNLGKPNLNPVMRMCIDATAGAKMASMVDPHSFQKCPKQTVQRSAHTIALDYACTFNGKPMTTHAVYTGNFDSAYTMTMTSEGDGGTIVIKTEAKWLGPCASDQRPGDVILGSGLKINVLDALKQLQHATPAVAPQR